MSITYFKVNSKNKDDVVRAYAHSLIENMDYDSLYSFTYSMIVENKTKINNDDLTKEIIDNFPQILVCDYE